jgi:hypothetical protein
MAAKKYWQKLLALAVAGGSLSACGDEGTGTVKFTTWGEEYIENEIPADPKGEDGFIDGWTVRYDKFLITFHEIKVANDKGEVAATMAGSRLVDNAKPGKKELVTFSGLPAKAWNRVSYQVKPATAASELVGASAADRDFMVANGYSFYGEGFASKDGVKKTYRWGFKTATQYSECKSAEESGKATDGVVVTNGGIDVSELTTHGDHLFYDRLKASPDPAIATVLRFDEKAAADKNGDNEVTLEELSATPIDVRKYDPSGFEAATLGDFVAALTRTIGHFRGEGECSVAPIR